MFSPKQLLCKQTGLILGKSVISPVDLSPTGPLRLTQAPYIQLSLRCSQNLKRIGEEMDPLVGVASSDSSTGPHLLVQKPFKLWFEHKESREFYF